MRSHRGAPLAALVLLLALIGAPGLAGPEPTAAAALRSDEPTPKPPDIVIILTDDQRTGLLDAMPAVRHRLVDLGVFYRNAFVPTSLCCPSRASILTGKFAHSTGVWHNGDMVDVTGVLGGQKAFIRNDNEKHSIALALDAAGYHTQFIGKYFNHSNPDRRPPGWDRWLPFDGLSKYYNYSIGHAQYGSLPHDYSTDVIARRSAKLIESAPTSRPLFLYVAPKAPHFPYKPAPRHRDVSVRRYLDDQDFGAINEVDVSDKPSWIQRLDFAPEKRVRHIARQQHRMMMSVDDLVTRILGTLQERGRLHNTLLVFMSDNGMQWGEHRITRKNMPYAGSTEVPMVLRWDARMGSGVGLSRLALNVDIAATVAQAARLDMPWVQGESLLRPTSRGGFLLEATVSEPYNDGRVRRPAYCGWRNKDRLFVRYNTGEEELYLLRRDPQERRNVADDPRYRASVQAMRERTHQACSPEPPRFSWAQ